MNTVCVLVSYIRNILHILEICHEDIYRIRAMLSYILRLVLFQELAY